MIQVKYYITHPTWLTVKPRLDWELVLAEPPESQHLLAGDGGGVDWEEHRKELKKLVLKQIPSWSLSVLSVPL